ncbi:MAG TPA: DUF1501 domain-containing protein [Opitutae bacterium]|nr:DUF1501 domain-containing protein [Opitutae bacterium]|tara:strand:+ start:515 stop:1765 length:1251 start_codon:yes stop_codon:yes gene_type:complete
MNNFILERRKFIERCALGAFGLSVLPDLRAAEPVGGGNGFGKAKRIIFLQVKGGMSHIDTFDPKIGPTKGPGDAIRTKADFQITEYLPKTAGVADRISVIRSMTAKVGVHGPAQYFMRTAFTQRNTIKHPNLGAWAQHYLGESHGTLPSSACINSGPKYGNGFFPTAFSPIPILNPDNGLRNIKTRGGSEALGQRLALSEKLSSFFSNRYPDRNVKSYREFYDNTLRLLRSKDLDSFDLGKEPAAMRQKYGLSKFGQGCLLARRLVETGVRYVEVATDGWDMHNNLQGDMEDLSPSFDQAYAALISDLDQRGMLNSTLVVLATEFGRKPQFNGNGRGHYPICFCSVLAGGGVKRGFVYGASDKTGAYPENPVTVNDLHATIGWAAGLPLKNEVLSSTGRPFVVGGAKAKPVRELFA